jgi:hypothetical protein
MSHQDVKPRRLVYVIPVLCLVGAIIISVFLGFSVLNMQKALKRVVMPGKVEVTLAEPGNYTLFYEYKSVVNNRTYSTGENLPDLEYSLVSKETGLPISLNSRGAKETTYDGPSHSGVSLYDFEISSPGEYVFSAWYPQDQKGKELVFAFSQGLPTGKMFFVVAIVFFLFFVGIILFFIIFVKRQKSRKLN